MKAIINFARGAASDTLKCVERSCPEPAAGEVRVAMKASGVNPSDFKVRSGAQGPMVADEVLVHNDGAGVIEAVGAGVDTARVGERVWLYNVNRSRCGLMQGVGGTAAEFISVPSALAVPLPETVDYAHGACLGVPAMTAHRALTWAGPVAGKVVLVTGGAGAVGHSAIQMAVALGARVVATISSDEKAQIARDAGAEMTINYREDDLAECLTSHLGPNGVDHVVDVDMAAHAGLYPQIMAMGGTVGAYATATSLTPDIPFYPLAMRNIAMQPVFVYSMSDDAKARAKSDINQLLAKGALLPVIAARHPLDAVVAAHEAVEEGGIIGNVVLEIGA